MGMGFWSKLDPTGQDAAVVIESEDVAREAMAKWDDLVGGCMFISELETRAD
ncbi:MAG TPA: hypothetical protein VEP50_16705 [bacterium]|nr:hypothetical protein [bacterium]